MGSVRGSDGRTPSLVPVGPWPGSTTAPGPSWQLWHHPGSPQQDCPSPTSACGTALSPPRAPRCPRGAALPVPSVSLLWTVCWPRCRAARCGSVLVCRGSWRAPVPCSAPSSPAWGGGAAGRTLRGSRSGGAGGTGLGGRAEPSRPAEPWRPGYPAETAAPSPSAAATPGLPLPRDGLLICPASPTHPSL